jgi:flagellar FliL protein
MSKKNIIIIAAVSLIVLAIIGGGFFMMWQKLSSLDNLRSGEESAKTAEKTEQGGIGPIFSLEPFIVNLSDQGGKRYLRITMGLELGESKFAEEMTKRLPQIRDSILMILPSRKVEELQTTEGKHSLRTEIVSDLNGLLGKEMVKKIYFTEFVIQ